jgi:tRNA-2-methylthio-N6-dimethylallyladenosine synthase
MARFAVTTFGCQMNVHDSERLAEVLLRAGYGRLPKEVEREEADVIILNTCSVREKAEHKLRSDVGQLAVLKRRRPELSIVVAGCVAQQEGQALIKRYPAIDIVIGPDNIPELPELLADVRLGGLPKVRTVFDVDDPQFLTAPEAASGKPTSFVTTMKGCNERCSFCVVPYTRGPERYRPSRQILDEITAMVDRGVREVMLLGQTVNSYRDPLGALPNAPEVDLNDPDESEFAALLRAIVDEVPDLLRLRYTSPHPRHLTPSLIAAHRDLECVPRHVHMPLQSGSSRMLKRMIRRHTREEYLERVARLRAAVPGVTVSTDIIVGFSGETDEDFEQTLSCMEEARFTGVYAFKYSRRPHTPALKMEDDVPAEVKGERLQRLFAVSERLMREHLVTLIGTTQRVLIEGPGMRPENLTGRSERNEIVHIPDALDLDAVGRIVEVEIDQAYKHSLRGHLADGERERLPKKAVGRRVLPLLGGAA